MIYSSFVSNNLPVIILVISVIGIVILFVVRLRTQKEKSLLKENSKMSQPSFNKKGVDINLKMQAYERLTFFLERTDPWRLLNTIDQSEKKPQKIESKILQTILTEFEYNLSQQVYVSDDLWSMIIISKNKTISLISSVKNSLKPNAKGKDFYDSLKLVLENQEVTPSKLALNYLKKEVRNI